MKVSLSWLGVFLISCVIIYFLVDAFHVYEAFTEKVPKLPIVREGFVNTANSSNSANEFTLTSCPAESEEFIHHRTGKTLCCNAKGLMNGKCSTKPICSLSEASEGIPTCSEWYLAYLEQKGANRCPPSMPFYFEKDGVRGCSSSTTKGATAKKCTLYNTLKEEQRNENSCTNVKLLETEQCTSPLMAGTTKKLFTFPGGDYPAYVLCSLPIPGGLPGQCVTDNSLKKVYDIYGPSIGWKDWRQSIGEWNKLSFCSIYKQIAVDKTKGFADLKNMRIP